MVIGGSTAIEYTVPEWLTWAEQLQSNLNAINNQSISKAVDVINAGVAGQTLLGNKIAVDLWLKKIKSLTPELIIIYYGHNDAVYTLGEFKNNNFTVL